MITGLPPHIPPVVEGVRCDCARYYRVYVGCHDYQSRMAEKEAEDIGAVFIDARRVPFYQCPCGRQLDFAPEASLMVQ
jgi:hypothetical protein